MRINIDYLKRFIDVDGTTTQITEEKGAEKEIYFKELFASIGMEVSEIIRSPNGTVYEIETTPNRPDWLGHCGVARDLHAKLPEAGYHPLNLKDRSLDVGSDGFTLRIEDPADCARYTGCIVRNITVKESSDAVKAVLLSLGLRPINNIVDISNLVLMTLGHPIHMFDLDKLKGGMIQVRRAAPGESLRLLSGEDVELDGELLVIADAEAPVALAGIMGGEFSGVTETSKDVLIESAHFNPVVVRKGSKKIAVSSDASYRFERGADIQITPTAIRLALDMIEESLGRDAEIDFYDDPFPGEYAPQIIEMPKNYPSIYTGVDIESETCEKILTNLGFSVNEKGDHWRIGVPSFRVDLAGKQDLVEEVIRIFGYHRLKSQIPLTANSMLTIDHRRRLIRKVNQRFTALGLFEAVNYIFYSQEDHRNFPGHDGLLQIKNPLGKDFSVLRQSLLPGLLRNTSLNFNQGMSGVGLFEVGNHYHRVGDGIVENEVVAVAVTGEYQQGNWQNKEGKNYDFFRLKSFLSTLFKELNLTLEIEEKHFPWYREGCSFSIGLSGEKIGHMGEIGSGILKFYKIDQEVLAGEIHLSPLEKHSKEGGFSMWNRYPSSRRDFSFLVNKATKYGELSAAISEIKPPELEYFDLVDRYEGKNLPDDQVSLSMGFSYSHPGRTLTTEEINTIHQKLTTALARKFNLVQR